MKISFRFLLVVNIILLVFDIQSFAQDQIDQYPGIPLVIYPNRRVPDMIDTYPNSLTQIKQMGVYGSFAPDVFNDPDYLEKFTIKGITVLPGYAWGDTMTIPQHIIWKYTNSHYTIWEAEGTDLTKGLATLYHHNNMKDTIDGNVNCIWTNNTSIPAGTELINGPGYPQNVTYNFSDQIVDYTAEYRMKITQRIPNLPQNYSDDIVCKIIVTNKFDGDSTGPGEEKTVDSLEVTVSQFSGWDNWKTIPIEYDLSNYKNTTQSMGDKGLRLPRGSAYFVQFKVIWYGLEYLNLFIDRINVYDQKGWLLMNTSGPGSPSNDIIQLVENNINNQTIVGWYGTDEPGSIDNYEPYNFVDKLIDNISNGHIRLHAAITGSWRGTFAYSNYDYGMAHSLYVADEFWLRAKPKNIQINTYMYHTPWTPDIVSDYKERNISLLTDAYYGRINNYDTSFAVSTQAGKYNFYNDDCTLHHAWIIPSTNQLNYQVNLSLLYGARELRLDPFFSSYSGKCTTLISTSGLIDINEQETDNYNFYEDIIIPRLNSSFGKELKKIHQKVQYPNLQLPRTQPINSTYNWLTSITYLNGDGSSEADFIDVGFFETHFESNDVPYFMVVNRWYNTSGQGDLLKINIDKTGTGYTNYNVTNFIENTKQTIVNSGYVTMPHISGEARLFKVYPVLKDGGSLVVSETTQPNDVLFGDMSIENGATLTVNGTYNAKANITVKSGGKIIAGPNGKIIFDPNKGLIIDGNAQVNGTSNNRLTLDFNSSTAAGVEVRFYNALTMSYCNINNAYVGINAENASNINISNINFTNCQGSGIVLFSFGNGDLNLPSSTSTISRCIINGSSTGISVVNADEVVITENSINNCNLGIYLNQVNSTHISSNNIIGYSYPNGSTMPGILMSSCGGYLRNNTIKYHKYGVQLAYSSPDMGLNTIEENAQCGLFVDIGSYPNLIQKLVNENCWYPIAGCNIITNNGIPAGPPPMSTEINPGGSEIYLNYGDVKISSGGNEVSDDRTNVSSSLTLPLITGIRGGIGTRELYADRNYWGSVGPSSERFGRLNVIYEPGGDFCPLPDAPCSSNEIIIHTSDGLAIDTLESKQRDPEAITTLEESYTNADKLFLSGEIEQAKIIYQQIVAGAYTSEEKLYAYNRLYEIGKLLREDDSYFTNLQTSFEDILSTETDTLLIKIYNQNAILCDVGKEEYLTAISKFDNIIQENPNSEEAVYAEIDIITTALNIDTTNSQLGKMGNGKYLVKGTSDYLTKLNNILQSKFGINSEEKEQIIPKEYSLYQNYPNPFNPVTTIKFDLPNDGLVQLIIFDILGRRITTLVDEYKTAGRYEQVFNASSLASGVYVYKLQAGDFISSKKMILLK